jgi:uncharacterized repeat protein (TIGR02543 family)
MNIFKKRIFTLIMAVTMMVSIISPGLAIAEDLSGHWAKNEIDKWTNKGIIKGYGDGSFRPYNEITRAEFTALLARIFNFVKTSDKKFPDVDANAWYADIVSKSVAAGIVKGDNLGNFNPNSPITRQEAAVILSRVFDLKAESRDAAVTFADYERIPDWSKEAISALVERRYVQGRPDNTFAPTDNMDRAEAVKMIDNIVAELINVEGVYNKNVSGSLVVSTADVTLEDMKIKGDLFLTQGIEEGDVTLNNVEIDGRVVVRGGGENSIVLNNTSIGGTLLVIKENGKVRVVVKGSSDVPMVMVNSNAIIVEEELTGAGISDIEIIEVEAGSTIELDGDFETIDIGAPDIIVNITGSNVENLNIMQTATNTKVIADLATIRNLIVDAKSSIEGNALIENAIVNGDGSEIESKPTTATIAKDIKVIIAGQIITDETEETPDETEELPDETEETPDETDETPGGTDETPGGTGETPTPVVVSAITITAKVDGQDYVAGTELPNEAGITVTLATATGGAYIYYTTNGDTPTADSTLYEGVFTVNAPGAEGGTVTIKAIGIKANHTNSAVATLEIKFKEKTALEEVSAITITTDPADVSGVANGTAVVVIMTTDTADAEIRYTTDGSIPTAESTLYSGDFTVNAPGGAGGTVTIKAIGIKANHDNSSVAEKPITFKAALESTLDDINADPENATIQMYADAGITGVTAGNLTLVNNAVKYDKGEKGSDLTKEEIQGIVDGINNEDAVVAAKAAIETPNYIDLVVDDFSDQTQKTAAVQAVVDGLKGSTTAVVSHSGGDNYSVAISKGLSEQTATVTATFKLSAVGQDNADIVTAITNIEAATYTATQAEAGTSNDVATKAQALVNALDLEGTTATVVPGVFTAAVAGTKGAPAGTNGSFKFTVKVNKGGGTEQVSAEQTMTITATAYVPSSEATLKATSKVKGVQVTSLGTPISDPETEIITDPGSVTISAAQAADTTGTGDYVTLFEPTDENITQIKVVKYDDPLDDGRNFERDPEYNDEAINNGDRFLVGILAEDCISLHLYGIVVMVQTPEKVGSITVTATVTGNPYNPDYPLPNFEGVTVKLETATEDADIYYTLDGNNPTVSSTKYTDSFVVDNSDLDEPKNGGTVVLKAIAIKDGYTDSDVATLEIKFDAELDKHTVSFSVVGGNGALEAAVGPHAVASGNEVEEGLDIKFTATPDAGYQVKEWKINGDVVANETGNTYIYILENLAAAVNVTVEFEEEPLPEKHTVTFDKNSGDTEADPKTMEVVDGEKVASLPTAPTKDGYALEGWNTKVDGSGDAFTTDTEVTADITVYAVWKVIEYDIVYHLDGGTNTEDNPGGYTIETDTITLAPGSKTGHSFDGWYDTETDGNKVTEITKGSTGDKILYARFTINTYTVTFKDYDGTELKSGQVEHGSDATAPTEDPTREGYKFDKWDTDFTNVTSDLTVTAQYSINQYTITFVSAGGSAVASITQNYDTAVTAPDHPTRTGYTFDGWEPGLPEKMPAMNPTLTAQWKAVEYDITYNLDGGINHGDNPVKYTIETDTITLKAAMKADYGFNGWYDAETDGIQVTEIAKGSTGDVTLYARWTHNKYTVTFVDHDGTVLDTQQVNHNGNATAPAEDPTREGYTFMGWDKEFTNVTGDLTVTALYEINEYTVSFELNYPTGEPNPEPKKVEYGQAVGLLHIPKDREDPEGKIFFIGWATDTQAKDANFTAETIVTGDITVYAVWKGTVNIGGFDIIPDIDGGKVGAATYADANEVIATLPTSVTAHGGDITVPVTGWENTDYDPNTPGWYTFTAILGDLPKWVTNTDSKTATVKVFIEVADINIVSFDIIDDIDGGKVGAATYADANEVIAALPTSVKANAGTITVPVTGWENTDYDPNTPGYYIFTAILGDLPKGVTNTNNETAIVKVFIDEPEEISVSPLDKNYYAAGDDLGFEISGLRSNEEVRLSMMIYSGGVPQHDIEPANLENSMNRVSPNGKTEWLGNTDEYGKFTVTGTVQSDLPYGELHIILPQYGGSINNSIPLQDNGENKVYVGEHKITFDVDGIPDQRVAHEGKVIKPEDPEDRQRGEGPHGPEWEYFVAWYTELPQEGRWNEEKLYDFNSPVTEPIELYAKWEGYKQTFFILGEVSPEGIEITIKEFTGEHQHGPIDGLVIDDFKLTKKVNEGEDDLIEGLKLEGADGDYTISLQEGSFGDGLYKLIFDKKRYLSGWPFFGTDDEGYFEIDAYKSARKAAIRAIWEVEKVERASGNDLPAGITTDDYEITIKITYPDRKKWTDDELARTVTTYFGIPEKMGPPPEEPGEGEPGEGEPEESGEHGGPEELGITVYYPVWDDNKYIYENARIGDVIIGKEGHLLSEDSIEDDIIIYLKLDEGVTETTFRFFIALVDAEEGWENVVYGEQDLEVNIQ